MSVQTRYCAKRKATIVPSQAAAVGLTAGSWIWADKCCFSSEPFIFPHSLYGRVPGDFAFANIQKDLFIRANIKYTTKHVVGAIAHSFHIYAKRQSLALVSFFLLGWFDTRNEKKTTWTMFKSINRLCLTSLWKMVYGLTPIRMSANWRYGKCRELA